MGLQDVGHGAAARAEREGESGDQQQRGERAQRPGVALGHRGARQIGPDVAERSGHARLVSLPERSAEGLVAPGQAVGLYQDWGMDELVRRLDAAIDFGRRRTAEGAKRNKRGQRGRREQHGTRELRLIQQRAEHAQPRQAEEKAHHDRERQCERPKPLQGDGQTGGEAGSPQAGEECACVADGSLFVHRPFRGGGGRRHLMAQG